MTQQTFWIQPRLRHDHVLGAPLLQSGLGPFDIVKGWMTFMEQALGDGQVSRIQGRGLHRDE